MKTKNLFIAGFLLTGCGRDMCDEAKFKIKEECTIGNRKYKVGDIFERDIRKMSKKDDAFFVHAKYNSNYEEGDIECEFLENTDDDYDNLETAAILVTGTEINSKTDLDERVSVSLCGTYKKEDVETLQPRLEEVYTQAKESRFQSLKRWFETKWKSITWANETKEENKRKAKGKGKGKGKSSSSIFNWFLSLGK